MTIHSLCPRRKLALYWVTKELAQVLSTEISCCISWMSSSLDSRSICKWPSVSLVPHMYYFGAHIGGLTCLIATVSPVALSIAL